ncbi:Ring finger domain protein [Mycena venus]|uniref:Ring finger domain protein n=1 Tax=Mycena venus TaxID=2733690 RepID=A0A8H6XRI2_9AGAR|nr:Ring finger domain protein [Mycena venus]
MSRSERGGIVANRSMKKSASAVPSTRTYVNEVSGHGTSRSPSRTGSGSRSDPFTLGTTSAAPTVKRKRSSTSVGTSTTPSALDDIDRGQHIKPKPSSSAQNRIVPSGSLSFLRPKKERERVISAQPPISVPPSDVQSRRGLDKGKSKQVAEVSSLPPTPVYSGPLAAAEYERMRKELETLKETLKRTVHDGKKQLKKQNKMIDELRAQVTAETLAREEKEKLLVDASSKSRKNEELLQTIETSLQCQICIELLSKPNVLAPCGHVFCLECLQQWFRSAPGNDSDDGMDPEDREEYILSREKSCPCCRTRVVRRPVPVFLVKSVVTALRSTTTQPIAAADEEDADPWKGLFLPDYESSESDDDVDLDGYGSSEDDGAEFFDHYSDDLEELDDAEMALALGLGAAYPQELTRFYASASESEDGSASDSDEDEEGEEENVEDEDEEKEGDSDTDTTYCLARWEPPGHVVEFENVSNSLWKMQRRGCTTQLIALFNMRYHHDEGLIAHVSSLDASEHDVSMGHNRLFLRWNIDIGIESVADSDVDGEAERAYIGRQLRDIRRHPERWMLTERHGYPGRMDARRLAPVEEDAEIYDTSDSEAYSNGEEFL